MKYRQIADTDLKVSAICLGCMGFGDPNKGQHNWTLDYESSEEIIKYALEKGINFFDTAIAYQSGTSEQYLGKVINKYAKREDVVIATKFLPRTNQEIEQGITGQKHIENMLNKSLQNLGMDYVDLYIYHMWDYNTPIKDILEGLDHMVKAGKTRYIGISNVTVEHLEEANQLSALYGYPRFVTVQNHYNLIFREEEKDMVPYCKENNISLTPYSSLAAGRLSRKPSESSNRLMNDSYAKLKYDAAYQQDLPIIERVEEIADKHNISMSEVSLSWLLEQVTVAVVGATKISHIDTACAATEFTLSEEEKQYLEHLYTPHKQVGVMAQNTASSRNEKHVWSTGSQKI